MTKKSEIYKCNTCGIITEILHAGGGVLKCCESSMVKLEEQLADSTKEKHVPIIEKQDDGYLVTIGSTSHPMIEKHYVEWIELIADGVSYKKFLNPNDEPKAFFKIQANQVVAREYCNLHGLWKS